MPTGSARVVVFDDDRDLQLLLTIALEAAGYAISVHSDGDHATHVAESFRPDLAVIDIDLGQGVDGLQIAKELRRVLGDSVSLLFLSGEHSIDVRLAAFEGGADDYVVKPFSVAELLARISAVLNRNRRSPSARWTVGDVVLDDASHTVTCGDRPVVLTATEFDLLRALMRQRGTVLSKQQLLDEVWQYREYASNLVEVHVSSIRKKLDAYGARLIETVRSVGYVVR